MDSLQAIFNNGIDKKLQQITRTSLLLDINVGIVMTEMIVIIMMIMMIMLMIIIIEIIIGNIIAMMIMIKPAKVIM